MEKTDLYALVNSQLYKGDFYLPICKQEKEFSNEPISQKNEVLNYLKSFDIAWFTSVRVLDEKTNSYIKKADHLYNDKKYEWSESEIYHFEKYNLILNEDFVNHIKNKLIKK